jgi:ribosomal protein S12 methylthiotransferase accessory factor
MDKDSIKAPERSLPLVQAHQQILAQLDELGLHASSRILGDKIVCVQTCLHTSDSKEVARGAGKGDPIAASVGALYEALEHYLSDEWNSTPLHWQTYRYFANHPQFVDDSPLSLLVKQQEARIVCRSYRSLIDGPLFSYPLALTCPRYCEHPLHDDPTDLRALRRYASNSGTAIGATYDEAVLHALNESIERDALSLFLLKHFYYQHPYTLRRVIPTSLGPQAHDALLAVNQQFNTQVVLLDISTEFCATTCLAFIPNSSTLPTVYGTGTSLDPMHAAWRALTELAQLKWLASEPPLHGYLLNAQRHLARFKRLQRSLHFDTRHLMARPVEWVTLQQRQYPSRLEGQINGLVENLAGHGLIPGVCTLFQSQLGTTLVHVTIPGLERFFLVSTGNVVVPQARGKRLCGEHQEVMA